MAELEDLIDFRSCKDWQSGRLLVVVFFPSIRVRGTCSELRKNTPVTRNNDFN